MENTINQAEQKNEPVNFWGPFIYMAFFIFFNLVLLPNAPKKIRMNNYDIEIILYGMAGIFTGILVYRIIRNTPSWFKFILVAVLYGIILVRLITHWKIFTVPGN
jgi:hypothetical protein